MTTQDNAVKPVIKYASNSTDVRVCYNSTRAVSTIERLPNGKYRVVKLYSAEVEDCDNYNKARDVAMAAPMTQAPRKRKAAA